MNIKKIFQMSFFLPKYKNYKDLMAYDEEFNAVFRNGTKKLSIREKRSIEYRAVRLYRKHQANADTIWGVLYRIRLALLAKKTGIEFLGNRSLGPGLIIGHWGRIVINGNTRSGSDLMVTHGVTIGRDIRGKHKGYPTLGNRVCIRANSTVVGGIVIGDDVLIAPNTFVNFDVPSHSIVIGNPATIHPREKATEGHFGTLGETI